MESQPYELFNSFINNTHSHSDNVFNEYELSNMTLETVLTLNNSINSDIIFSSFYTLNILLINLIY